MENDVYSYLKSKGLKPFLGKYKDGKKELEVIVWTKNKAEATDEMKNYSLLIKSSNIKEISVEEAKKLDKERKKIIEKFQKEFQENISKQLEGFKSLVSKIDDRFPIFQNIWEQIDDFFNGDNIFASFLPTDSKDKKSAKETKSTPKKVAKKKEPDKKKKSTTKAKK